MPRKLRKTQAFPEMPNFPQMLATSISFLHSIAPCPSLSLVQFHQQILPVFFAQISLEAFTGKWRLANSVWLMAHIFGKLQTNLEKFSTVVLRNSELVKLNGEFFAERCLSATFRFTHKVR
jgi:hypothetical protein